MSTLRVTGLKQETSTATNISLAVGGGVTVAGVSTFHNAVTASSGITITTQDTSTNPLSIASKGGGTNDGHLEGEGPKINFLATRSADGANASAAYIQQKAIGDLGSSWPVDLAFGVRRFGSPFEAMRIASTGYVGIGTDIPAGQFQVGQSGGSNVIITENTGVDINDGAINLYQATSNADAAPFIISTDVGGTETEKLRVTGGGYVGIGTNNPERPCHIFSDTNALLFLDSSTTNADLVQADPSGSTRIRNNSGELKIYTGGDASAPNANNSVEKVRIGSGHIGISTFVIAGQTNPVSTANTTAHIQSASQIIAVQGVLTRNGGWSMLPTTRVTLTRASDSINGHTVVIDTAGLNGANHATLIRVSFAMRRGNTSAAFSQKSEYMGLWDITKISTDEHIDVNHIVQRELTVTSTTYASNTITMTFNTDNVRSFTARAFEYCTTGELYTGV